LIGLDVKRTLNCQRMSTSKVKFLLLSAQLRKAAQSCKQAEILGEFNLRPYKLQAKKVLKIKIAIQTSNNHVCKVVFAPILSSNKI